MKLKNLTWKKLSKTQTRLSNYPMKHQTTSGSALVILPSGNLYELNDNLRWIVEKSNLEKIFINSKIDFWQ